MFSLHKAVRLTHPPTWSTLPVRSDLTSALLSLPHTDSHSHAGTWRILPCRPAGPLHHPSLLTSLPSWICPEMPEGNEATGNGKVSRQLGRIWVADKISWFIISIMVFHWLPIRIPPLHPPLSLHVQPFSSQTSLLFSIVGAGQWLKLPYTCSQLRDRQPLPQCISSAIHLVQHLATTTSKCFTKMCYSPSVHKLHNYSP